MLVIFLISYHNYSFYREDMGRIFKIIKPTALFSQYEAVQKQHPYYQIYTLARRIDSPEQNIIYVRTKVDKRDPSYLHELTIMLNYFFYPNEIGQHSIKEFQKLTLIRGMVVVSDTNLEPYFLDKGRIEPLWFPPPKLKRINRWPEDQYYTYIVKS